MLVDADLPNDPAVLIAMLVEAREQIANLQTVSAEANAEIERLSGIIAALNPHRFGTRSEQLSDDQLSLAFEETEVALAPVAMGLESARPERASTPRNARAVSHRAES
ncbi:transposase [Sphingomonas sp. ZB1N12]|uniref:transposase n=1 Tax=Sphingomonas arabinosi TaxID=3096160 RepID=UPI002FC5E09F